MTRFVQEQVTGFQSLVGLDIAEWQGVEMALRECGADGSPQFFDPAVPYLQFLTLTASLTTSEFVKINTYQSGERWGLQVMRLSEVAETEDTFSGIYLARPVPEIPSGQIHSVKISCDPAGDIERVSLHVGSHTVSLIAGEVYEEMDGSLRIQLGSDESVLVSVAEHA